MQQQFSIDRRWAIPYLAILVAACGGRQPHGVIPINAPVVTVAIARGWAAATTPTVPTERRFRWQLQDDRGAAGGRGTARVAPPDSVRLDVVGPLGAGRGAAVVVGDSAMWTDPPDIIQRLVPSYPLMWAMFGVMRLPPANAQIRGADEAGVLRWAWHRGADTVAYVWNRDAGTLEAEVRQNGEIVGRVATAIAPDGTVLSSLLVVPRAPARLNLTFIESNAAANFSPALWLPPGH